MNEQSSAAGSGEGGIGESAGGVASNGGSSGAGPALSRSLGPVMLWGLGVGYVISGMYFGWNLGLAAGGTGGLAIATAAVILLYITFTFSYTELACAIPKAGGVFDYANRGLKPGLGIHRWGSTMDRIPVCPAGHCRSHRGLFSTLYASCSGDIHCDRGLCSLYGAEYVWRQGGCGF